MKSQGIFSSVDGERRSQTVPTAHCGRMLAPHESEYPVVGTPGTLDENNQSGGLRIRSYKPHDHKTVCELFVQGMLEYCPPNENQILRDYVDESLDMDLAGIQGTYFDAGGHFWVATIKESGDDDETIVGAIAIDAKGDGRGEVRRLTVSKGYIRQGVARKLVKYLENWAREHGFEAIFLNCGDEMGQALCFYDTLGFARTHEEVLCGDPYQCVL